MSEEKKCKIGTYVQLKTGAFLTDTIHSGSMRQSASAASFVYYPEEHMVVMDVSDSRVLLYGPLANWYQEEWHVWDLSKMVWTNASFWARDHDLNKWKDVSSLEEFGHRLQSIDSYIIGNDLSLLLPKDLEQESLSTRIQAVCHDPSLRFALQEMVMPLKNDLFEA